MNKYSIKFSIIHISLIAAIILITNIVVAASFSASLSTSTPISAQKQQVTITAALDYLGDAKRWDIVLQPSLQELRLRHPDIDIMSVDQIWLGEFAEKGFLTDLTDRIENWRRSSDWYEEHWDGGVYNDKIYGIWAISDIRGMWYWKDLLVEADVDPNSLKTWDGYIASAKKLNAALKDKGIQGMHLVGASHSPDMSFYPYLWMLGGEIVERRDGHPSKGIYYYPVYNSTEGVMALEFIKEQVHAGIKPQVKHFSGKEFADRKFAVMLEGTWLLGFFPRDQWPDLEQKLGFIPMFPVPS